MTPLRWLLTVLSFATAVGASIYVVAADWPEGGAALGLPLWAHFAAMGIVAFDITARTLKVQLSARAVGVLVSFTTALRMSLGGDFGASITPARSGAEPARFLIMRKAGYPVAQVLVILFIELLLEVLSLVAFTIVFFVLLDHSSPILTALVALVGGLATIFLTACGMMVVMARRNATGPPPRWARRFGIKPGAWRRVQRALRQIKVSMAALRRARPITLVAAYFFSVAHVFARLMILPLLVYAYGDRPPLAPLLVWPLVLLYGSSAAPVPAGGGMVEFSFKAALGGHIPAQLIASSLIWWRVYTFYAYLVLGAMSAGRSVMHALREKKDDVTNGISVSE
ncbi:MAG: lysylphosphatidylglycerol synthase transmembrane domain-containing protein [Gemmatimonadaceae bacterium]